MALVGGLANAGHDLGPFEPVEVFTGGDERDRLLLTTVSERQARLSAEFEAARAAGQFEPIWRQSWYQFWKPKMPKEG